MKITVIMVIIAFIVFYYKCYKLQKNELATNELINHWDFFKSRMRTKGYELGIAPYSQYKYVPPCDIIFGIESESVCIHGKSWAIYRLIKQIDSNKISKEQLEAKSFWPSEKLPL